MKTIEELKEIQKAKQLYQVGISIAGSFQAATTPLSIREAMVVSLLSAIDRVYSDDGYENKSDNSLISAYPTIDETYGLIVLGYGDHTWFTTHYTALVAAEAKHKAYVENERVAKEIV